MTYLHPHWDKLHPNRRALHLTHNPLYDIHKSFQENMESPFPFCPIPEELSTPSLNTQLRLFDYPITTAIGAAACAVTTSRGIIPLSRLGFDILTYKTIRSHLHPSHPWPNITYLNAEHSPLTPNDIGQIIHTDLNPPLQAENITISNSLGNPSLDSEHTAKDIDTTKQALQPGQVLIVSVYGSEQRHRSLLEDFVWTAQLAQESGADVIELNLSCPNLGPTTYLYHDIEKAYTISQQVVRAVHKPVIAKIGWMEDPMQVERLLQALARGGIVGVAAINSVSMQVTDSIRHTQWGHYRQSGVSGHLIRELTLTFIKLLSGINNRNRLDLTLLGMGGVTQANHFTELHQAGAHIALSATGTMWNPYLALQYRQQLLCQNP